MTCPTAAEAIICFSLSEDSESSIHWQPILCNPSTETFEVLGFEQDLVWMLGMASTNPYKIWPGMVEFLRTWPFIRQLILSKICFVSPPFTLSTPLQEPMVLNHPSIWTLQILNLPVAYLAHLTQNLHLLICTRQAFNHWYFRLHQGSHGPLSLHVTRSCRNQFTGFC